MSNGQARAQASGVEGGAGQTRPGDARARASKRYPGIPGIPSSRGVGGSGRGASSSGLSARGRREALVGGRERSAAGIQPATGGGLPAVLAAADSIHALPVCVAAAARCPTRCTSGGRLHCSRQPEGEQTTSKIKKTHKLSSFSRSDSDEATFPCRGLARASLAKAEQGPPRFNRYSGGGSGTCGQPPCAASSERKGCCHARATAPTARPCDSSATHRPRGATREGRRTAHAGRTGGLTGSDHGSTGGRARRQWGRAGGGMAGRGSAP